jgi:hypothetical protein
MDCPTPILLVLTAATMLAGPAAASHDPNRTATIYVHGFELEGADRHGVYGEDAQDSLLAHVALLLGLPAAGEPGGALAPNVVTGTTYYGDTPPPYYSAQDVAEVEQVTAQWGGGVPRYALILAKYARNVLARSGAQQVNFVSGSFGSLIVRWLIEKDVGGLASQGKIARWLTAEGVLCGNWVASHNEVVGFLDFLSPLPIDVEHMSYGWIEANLHAPHTEASSPLYAGILIGQIGSTDDSFRDGALSALMATYRDYQPNDGVQALGDTYFHTMAGASRLMGMPPTLGLFHVDHFSLSDHPGAWAEASSFITQKRRVTVTMTSAQVLNLHEPQLPFWDWRPAEVVLESRVYSPAAEARWGIVEPLTTSEKEGTVAPLRRFNKNGETQTFTHVLFDQMVLADETSLRLELHAEEVDYDAGYGVYETISTPYFDDLGRGTLVVSTLQPGTYAFQTGDWACTLAVSIVEYPFAELVAVPIPSSAGQSRSLMISPNPFSSSVRIAAAGATAAGSSPATLVVYDASGRRVRTIRGDLGAGFLWDGRDDRGRSVPAGVYLHRVTTRDAVLRGRSFLVR